MPGFYPLDFVFIALERGVFKTTPHRDISSSIPLLRDSGGGPKGRGVVPSIEGGTLRASSLKNSRSVRGVSDLANIVENSISPRVILFFLLVIREQFFQN